LLRPCRVKVGNEIPPSQRQRNDSAVVAKKNEPTTAKHGNRKCKTRLYSISSAKSLRFLIPSLISNKFIAKLGHNEDTPNSCLPDRDILNGEKCSERGLRVTVHRRRGGRHRRFETSEELLSVPFPFIWGSRRPNLAAGNGRVAIC